MLLGVKSKQHVYSIVTVRQVLTLIVQPVSAASGCIAQVACMERRWARHLARPIEGARSYGAIDQVLPLVHGGVPVELQRGKGSSMCMTDFMVAWEFAVKLSLMNQGWLTS